MQQININELKPHPRNNEFFDDITGDKWEELVESIRSRVKSGKRGNIEPIIVTQDKIIVSGHQRVRAFKELNIPTIESEVKIYNSDDEILQELIESNIRQRGEIGGSAKQVLRRIEELERIYGIRNGSAGGNGSNQYSKKEKVLDPNNLGQAKITQKDIANKLGMSLETLRNYKMLTDLIPEIEELLDTGIVTKTTAKAIVTQLSDKEQLEFISSLDTTQKITKKEVQQYINRIKQLESNNPKVKELERQISDLKIEKSLLERKVKLNQEESDKYNKLKTEIEFLTKQKSDLGRQIDSATELAGLTVRLQKLLEDELAPIKFKRCMETLDSSDVCVNNLEEIIAKLDDWSFEMKKLLTNRYDDVIDEQ